jgi:hypothetical protein
MSPFFNTETGALSEGADYDADPSDSSVLSSATSQPATPTRPSVAPGPDTLTPGQAQLRADAIRDVRGERPVAPTQGREPSCAR